MMADWVWNDGRIGDEQELYRHVPRREHDNAKKRIDPLTRQWTLTNAAFTKEEMLEDGWSIYRQELLVRMSLDIADIECSGSEPREVWALAAGHVRAIDECGVIDSEDVNDRKLGPAHGLIRCSTPKPEKRKIVELRNWLIAKARPV